MAAEFLLGPANGVALIIQQAADLADGNDIGTLIVAAVATALDRRKLRELLLPVSEHVRFYSTKFGNFTNGEITLPRYRG